MSDATPSPETLARRHRRIVDELRALRRRLGPLGGRVADDDASLPAPQARARVLDDLEQRLHDLARDQRRLRRALDTLLDTLDDDPPGDLEPPPGLESDGTDGDPRSVGIPKGRGPLGLARWLARGLGWRLRALLATLRPPPPAGEIPLAAEMGAPATELPRLVRGHWPHPDDRQSAPAEGMLRPRPEGRHTAPGDPSTPRGSGAGDVLIEGTVEPPWPRGTCELLQLLFASEDLDGAELSLGPAGPLLRCSDLSAGDGKGPRLIKVIHHDGGESAALAESGETAAGRYRCPSGRPPRRHALHDLARVGGIEPVADTEKARWLVRLDDLLDGRDQLLAQMLSRWTAGGRDGEGGPAGEGLVVVFERRADRLDAERRRALAAAYPELLQLPLGDALAPAVVPSALVPVARRHRPERLVDLASAPVDETLRRVLEGAVPDLEILTAPWPQSGLPWVAPLDPPADPVGSRTLWRHRLGLDDETLLVARVGDLLPHHQGEDFVRLAHQLGDDPRFAFLLLGRGRSAGAIDDLTRFLAPPRYHRLDAAPAAEILLAADIVCSTAEHEPVGQPLLSALALGRPVVAADPRLAPLLTPGDPARHCGHLATVGDVGSFATALDLMADPGHLQRLATAAPAAAEPWAPETLAERYRRWLG